MIAPIGRICLLGFVSFSLCSCGIFRWIVGGEAPAKEEGLTSEGGSIPAPSQPDTISQTSLAAPAEVLAPEEESPTKLAPTPETTTVQTGGGWDVDNPTTNLPSRQDLQPTLPLPTSAPTTQESQPITVQP